MNRSKAVPPKKTRKSRYSLGSESSDTDDADWDPPGRTKQKSNRSLPLPLPVNKVSKSKMPTTVTNKNKKKEPDAASKFDVLKKIYKSPVKVDGDGETANSEEANQSKSHTSTKKLKKRKSNSHSRSSDSESEEENRTKSNRTITNGKTKATKRSKSKTPTPKTVISKSKKTDAKLKSSKKKYNLPVYEEAATSEEENQSKSRTSSSKSVKKQRSKSFSQSSHADSDYKPSSRSTSKSNKSMANSKLVPTLIPKRKKSKFEISGIKLFSSTSGSDSDSEADGRKEEEPRSKIYNRHEDSFMSQSSFSPPKAVGAVSKKDKPILQEVHDEVQPETVRISHESDPEVDSGTENENEMHDQLEQQQNYIVDLEEEVGSVTYLLFPSRSGSRQSSSSHADIAPDQNQDQEPEAEPELDFYTEPAPGSPTQNPATTFKVQVDSDLDSYFTLQNTTSRGPNVFIPLELVGSNATGPQAWNLKIDDPTLEWNQICTGVKVTYRNSPSGFMVGALDISPQTIKPFNTHDSSTFFYWVISGEIILKTNAYDEPGTNNSSTAAPVPTIRGFSYKPEELIIIPPNVINSFENHTDQNVVLGFISTGV